MGKAIAIINKPENCADCELCCKDGHYGTCVLLRKIVVDLKTRKSIIDNQHMKLKRHWDCPLTLTDDVSSAMEKVDDLLHFMHAVENPEWMEDTVRILRDEVIRLRAKSEEPHEAIDPPEQKKNAAVLPRGFRGTS